MSRTHQIHAPEAHVAVSHGADFFGEDRHPLKSLTSLAGYAEGCLSRDERGRLRGTEAECRLPWERSVVLHEELFVRPVVLLRRGRGGRLGRGRRLGAALLWRGPCLLLLGAFPPSRG